MRLYIEPAPDLETFRQELELVIHFVDNSLPEVYWQEGMPRPDKHLLLGVVQTASMAVSERDKDLFVLTPECKVALFHDNAAIPLETGTVIVRSNMGKIGVLAIGELSAARRQSREIVRYFTGTVRLDIP